MTDRHDIFRKFRSFYKMYSKHFKTDFIISMAGVEIVGVRQSEDCQKFGRTAEDGVSGKFGNIFTSFYSQCRSSTTATTPIDQVENDRREPTGLLTSYWKLMFSISIFEGAFKFHFHSDLQRERSKISELFI